MTGVPRLWAAALLAAMVAAVPARAERLIASLSSQTVEITSSFTGVELVLFGAVENNPATEPLPRSYDIVATAAGPRQELVTRRKERMFGIWVNAASRTFDAPSYLTVLANRPLADIAGAETLRLQRIGLANAAFAQTGTGDTASAADQAFREAFMRIKRDRGFYLESTSGVTFLTPTLYRASILLTAEAPVGNYEVDLKLFADGELIAHTTLPFKIATVGFEQFIAASAVDHGVLYGIATAIMALATGWFASVVFRRD